MNNQRYHIGHEALKRFTKHTGIAAEFSAKQEVGHLEDATIHLQDPRFPDVFDMEIKNEVRNHHLPALLDLKEHNKRPYILIGKTIFPSVKDYLRKNGINYIDMAGNASIQTDQAVIYIDGQKWQDETHPMLVSRAFTKTGLRVVYLLLTDPEAGNYPVRLLAELTGASVGGVNNTLTGLLTMGFLRRINKTTTRIDLRETLVERWISGYQERLKPALHLGNFRMKGGMENWEQLNLDAGSYWSGEAAAYKIRKNLFPKTVSIYTGMEKLDFMKRNQLIPHPEGEITVYQRFWNGQIGQADTHLAPVLLIYADLTDTMDPRCLDEAQELIKEHKL